MSLPPEIKVQPRPHGAIYELPARKLGCLSFVGLFVTLIGLFFVIFALAWIVTTLGINSKNGFNLFNLLISAFGVPFVIAGLYPLRLGVLILAGRCTIELEQSTLRVREHAGLFRWSRKREMKGLTKLDVAAGNAKVNGQPVTSGPLADLSALSAHFAEGKPWPIAIGYPRSWLKALADDLAQRLKTNGITTTIGESVAEVSPEERYSAGSVEPDRPIQPAASKVKLEQQGDGIVLTVPPTGLVKGSKGLFVFACIWCGFMLVFTAIMVGVILSGKSKDGFAGLLFSSLFWAIGIGMMCAAINMGRRRAMLMANPRELRIVRQSPFGTKKWQWPAAEITAIRLGSSGMKVNNRVVNELQIETTSGRTGLFSERDDEEILWMATVMRNAIQLPGATSDQSNPPA